MRKLLFLLIAFCVSLLVSAQIHSLPSYGGPFNSSNVLVSSNYAGSGYKAYQVNIRRILDSSGRQKTFFRVGDTASLPAKDSVFFFGTSITYGTGAKDNIYRWSTRTANALNTTEVNKGIPGTTVEHFSAGDSCLVDRIYLIPNNRSTIRYVVIEEGTNDATNTPDSAGYRAALNKVMDSAMIARALPAYKLVLVANSFKGYLHQAQDTMIRNITRQIAAQRGCYFVDVYSGFLAGGTGYLMLSDTIHPNVLGHAMYTERVLNTLPDLHGGIEQVHGTLSANMLTVRPFVNNLNLSTVPALIYLDDTAMFTGGSGGLAQLRIPYNSPTNFGFGQSTMQSQLSSAIENTGVGYQALKSNIFGSGNSAFGKSALGNNTIGFNNTATGDGALFNNGGGNNNTATGYNALLHDTSGLNNTATGSGAMAANINGSTNAAFGVNALGVGTAPANCAVFGYNAFQNNTNTNNTGIGYQVGQNSGNAQYSVFIGYLEGQGETNSGRLHIGVGSTFEFVHADMINHLAFFNPPTSSTTLPLTTVAINGGLATPMNESIGATASTDKTAAYTLVQADYMVTGNTTSGAFTFTLPTAVGRTGQEFIIMKVDASANVLTVGTTSSQTINGSTTYTGLTGQWKYVHVKSTGTGYYVIASN